MTLQEAQQIFQMYETVNYLNGAPVSLTHTEYERFAMAEKILQEVDNEVPYYPI